ncbi:SRPBCC domain-containing protein [Micromonospora echinaurantiaca]|uniref:SRPBCC family protein n=1 Tax=Micromonospora echinaurantiaca TaxID=47857 RepID=UPI00378D1439
MKITNEFAVNTPIERAWAMLTDLEGIAPCLPGAQLTGVDGDVYRGKVKVKVGPVVSEFAGTARFVEMDGSRYRGVIDAKGRDARSAGNASALVTAQLRPDGDRTLVTVDTDLTISGKLAQFGSGMIKEVSAKLLAQFVANLEARLAAEEASGPAPAGSPAGSTGRPESAAAATTPGTPPATATTPSAPAALVDSSDSPAAVPAPPDTPAAVVASPDTSGTVAASPDTPAAVVASPDTSGTLAASAGTATVAATPAARPASTVRAEPAAEPEALDLLGIAGGSIAKRLVPVVVGLVVVGAVIAWLVARR